MSLRLHQGFLAAPLVQPGAVRLHQAYLGAPTTTPGKLRLSHAFLRAPLAGGALFWTDGTVWRATQSWHTDGAQWRRIL